MILKLLNNQSDIVHQRFCQLTWAQRSVSEKPGQTTFPRADKQRWRKLTHTANSSLKFKLRVTLFSRLKLRLWNTVCSYTFRPAALVSHAAHALDFRPLPFLPQLLVEDRLWARYITAQFTMWTRVKLLVCMDGLTCYMALGLKICRGSPLTSSLVLFFFYQYTIQEKFLFSPTYSAFTCFQTAAAHINESITTITSFLLWVDCSCMCCLLRSFSSANLHTAIHSTYSTRLDLNLIQLDWGSVHVDFCAAFLVKLHNFSCPLVLIITVFAFLLSYSLNLPL